MPTPQTTIEAYFGTLKDPRGDARALRHDLLDIMSIALCAVLSGAESFTDMERFGEAKKDWLRERLGLRLLHGIPSHDTFGRVFASLDPEAFAQAFTAWTQTLNYKTQGEVIALDGKTLRRSFDTATGKAALHVVTAWACANRLVLAQQAVDQKSNEIKAIPQLLDMLDIKGCVVTADALNTQRSIAQKIVEKEGDYILALKENHNLLYRDVADFCEWARDRPGGLTQVVMDGTETREWAHGRHEVRRCWCLQATAEDWPEAVRKWKGLRTIVCLESERREQIPESQAKALSVPERETRYYLSSLEGQAPRLLQGIRAHWGIENSAHWVLDVAFDEDHCRIRKQHAARNMAALRRLALNLLRKNTSDKKGIKARRLRAAWNHDYLLDVLSGPAT
jgi:predicted transposase YbfD/YdcC